MFSEHAPTLQTACGSPAYVAPEMIQRQPYTQAADIWSSGVVLFAITAGYLPFDDENVQRLLQKVVYSAVEYPIYFSAPLIDLLEKMLCKEPENRITIDGVKTHPWFSQTEYMALVQEAGQGIWESGEGPSASMIDPDIIGMMNGMGVDCHRLTEELLADEFTDLTGLYRILRREKITERNKDLFTRVPALALSLTPTPRQLGMFKPKEQAAETPRGLGVFGKVQITVPTVPRPPSERGAPKVPAPVPGAAGRRLSRPVAIRRPVAGAGTGAGAHETP
jgi:hypothetical protein